MNIRLDGEGRVRFQSPQQQWHDGRGGDPDLMQVANFAGQPLTALTDDKGGFDLHYLGFTEGPYPTMEKAKECAPAFALSVLDLMKSKISD